MKRTCTEPECDKTHRAKGLCSMHWKRQYGKPQRYRITCDWCGASHKTPRRNGRFCSRECYGAMLGYQAGTNFSNLPQSHPALPERIPDRAKWPSIRVFFTTCVACGTLFATPYTVLTCGKQCAKAKRRDDRREGEHRRRARLRNAYVAPVSRRAIHERDRWRCHICGKAVKRRAQVPDPKAPTLDHLIPIAAGGTHEPANVRTAHFLCNSLKSDRGGNEQLMLIG